ncbi:von Willebrand factor type A domain-containing protein [Flagelloscypha sp. PMI_526]|nr:von Willebrand factor type A domain-containing protein [Flagelloscypha sp. PMI_526]
MPARLSCELHAPSKNAQFLLDGSKVEVLIADVHASVKISQRFTNPLGIALDATYTFGLLANAAVCGFKMMRADGTEVEGVVKEKSEAKEEFDNAVKQGYTAALGTEETKDVFSISVGNIAANETVTVNLCYLQLLTDDEKRDQIRFVFPRTYAQRYGSAPTINAATASTVHQRFFMDIVVQQSSTIKSIACPSGHPMQLELGKPDCYSVDDSVSDSQMAKVTLSDPSASLSQDILLVITAQNLDNPRCFVEAHPSSGSDDTVALGLTFVPRFTLPDTPGGMEYIFVVDRSGSMRGESIQLVQEALVVLLRGLPSKGTKLNIISFGTRSTKFWESSQAYTQSNLEAATSHVDSMQADYGGTEIASALDTIFTSLATPLSQPVAVFLLTDGGAWDVANCVAKTKNAIAQQATKANFMRVFTVGIGNGVSTDTCDSIAVAGGGISTYVGPNEPVVGKCSRLVRAARTPPIHDLRIFWTGDNNDISSDDFEMVDNDTTEGNSISPPGTDATSATVSLFDIDAKENQDDGPSPIPPVQLLPPSPIQQAPLQPRSLFPGTRSIKVRGIVSTSDTVVEVDVPVCKLAQAQGSRFDFLHILAAKALINDRENLIHDMPSSITCSFKDNNELRDAYLKADIVRLGTKYGLSSLHTNFIAVDRRTGQTQPRGLANTPSFIRGAVPYASRGISTKKFAGKSLRSARIGVARGALSQSSPLPPGGLVEAQKTPRAPSPPSAPTVVHPKVPKNLSQPKKAKVMRFTDSRAESSNDEEDVPVAQLSKGELQHFDGGFSLTPGLLELLGVVLGIQDVRAVCAQHGLNEGVVATVLARTWLFDNGGEESLDMQEKALEWLGDQLASPETVTSVNEKLTRSISFS